MPRIGQVLQLGSAQVAGHGTVRRNRGAAATSSGPPVRLSSTSKALAELSAYLEQAGFDPGATGAGARRALLDVFDIALEFGDGSRDPFESRHTGKDVFAKAKSRIKDVREAVANGEALLVEDEPSDSEEEATAPTHVDHSRDEVAADVGVITGVDVNVFRIILRQMTGQAVRLDPRVQAARAAQPVDSNPELSLEEMGALGKATALSADLSPRERELLRQVRQSQLYEQALVELRRSGTAPTKEGGVVAFSTAVSSPTRDPRAEESDTEPSRGHALGSRFPSASRFASVWDNAPDVDLEDEARPFVEEPLRDERSTRHEDRGSRAARR